MWKSFNKAIALLNSSEFTVESDLLNGASVGNALAGEPASLSTKEFTPETGLIRVVNVGIL